MTTMASTKSDTLPVVNNEPDEIECSQNTSIRETRDTATTSSSSSTTNDRPRNTGKAQRRVSFTTATTVTDPPSMVVVNDDDDHPRESNPADTPEEENIWNETACTSPSPSRRRSSLSSLQATPHHSNLDHHAPSNATSSATYLKLSQSFPQPRLPSPYRKRSVAASRRSSLDSCSTYSSAISSSCYSTGSLASVLSSKDEVFQRAKLLTCLEWLGRHISRHLIQQLMQQVQQEQEEDPRIMNSSNYPRRHSTSAIRRRSEPTTSNSSRSRRQSQPPDINRMLSARRPSCSFVHCESGDGDESRHKQRLLKTQESLDRLSSEDPFSTPSEEDDEMLGLGYESTVSLSSWGNSEEATFKARAPLPPPQPHQTGLLLVDISGFTKLSTTLPLQALSQTINAYFQSIIECIQEYGGDVFHFAGDAVMAEWREDEEDELVENGEKVHVVRAATACACQIIERCSDYHVYQNDVSTAFRKNNDDAVDNKLLATLNVHCGVGYGSVEGFHVGDDTRREYMLLGDPIPQAADAIALGRGGEVVASPQAFQVLSEEHGAEKEEKPKVVFSSRRDRFETRPDLLDRDALLLAPPKKIGSTQEWVDALEDWDLFALDKLQQTISLYVHPAVVQGELFTTAYHNSRRGSAAPSTPSDSSSDSSRQNTQQKLEHEHRLHQSEAEIRKVFTLFLQPLVPVNTTGDPDQDEAVMSVLNEIMLLANRELARFKGHLRQFILDDKGVVLIANFGLRGTMFHRMIENNAMPFAASIQSVLKSELNVECRMGATYGNAYCGVVGGLDRHEFSVLGPAVNLSARLMGNPENCGFLVDEAVRNESHGWQFHDQEPVHAKGYADLVPIFQPVMHKRSLWTRQLWTFVGRKDELEAIVNFSDDVVSCSFSPGKLVLISGASGFGKSSLLSEAVDRIQQQCAEQKKSHLVLGQICSDDDLFRPMSVLGPILLDILSTTGIETSRHDPESTIELVRCPAGTTLCDNETALAAEQFYAACERAEIARGVAESIYSLVFHHEWPRSREDDASHCMDSGHCISPAEEYDLARSIVSILLQATVAPDLVLLGIDDISLMDELSWRVLQLWFEHACNLLVISASNPVSCKDIHIAPSFWEYLFSDGVLLNRFLHIELPPMDEGDIRRLIAQAKCAHVEADGAAITNSSSSQEISFAHEVYMQSGGNPRLAASMVQRFADDFDSSEETANDVETHEGFRKIPSSEAESSGVAEQMLTRMDAVPAVAHTHLNLAAILGESFRASDIVQVMERYRQINEDEKEEHSEFVYETLNEAVWHGILTRDGGVLDDDADAIEVLPPCATAMVCQYRFTHELWRERILQRTLESWQAEMRKLIEEVVEIDNGAA